MNFKVKKLVKITIKTRDAEFLEKRKFFMEFLDFGKNLREITSLCVNMSHKQNNNLMEVNSIEWIGLKSTEILLTVKTQ